MEDNRRKLSPSEGRLAFVGDGVPSGKDRLADGDGGGEARKDCEVDGLEMAHKMSIVTTH